MKDNLCLQNFDEEDLISFNNREKIIRIKNVKNSCNSTFLIPTDYKRQQIGKTAQALHSDMSEKIVASDQWLSKGVDCEVLRLGEKQWTKGRIKIQVVVEFYPDEEVKPLSDLDAFRDAEACSLAEPAT
jgi:KGK domain